MNIMKKQLRNVYNSMKKQTTRDMLEYCTGYVNGLIMGMFSSGIISIEQYLTYHKLIDKTYEKKCMEVKR